MPAKKQILKPLAPVQQKASDAYFYRALNMHGRESIVAAYRECYPDKWRGDERASDMLQWCFDLSEQDYMDGKDAACFPDCYDAPDSAALLDHHYQTWLTEQGLPQWSADDLMFSQAPDVPQVNKAQGNYLKYFILVWECINNP